MDGAWPLQRERFGSFVETISTYDALCEQENLALRAQVHDLTELLAAFDFCELQNPHLIAVRDRAFQRDFIPDEELLRVCCMERQLQQESIQHALEDELAEQDMANCPHGQSSEVSECLENHSSIVEEIDGLQQRIELLEQEVTILHLRQELSEETTSRSQWRVATVDGDQASQDQDTKKDQEQRDRHVSEEQWEETTRTIQEQKERIVELEKALAMESDKNAAMQQQIHCYRQVESILLEFSRCHSSASSL
ncbi:hypothetical protein DD237_001094 [Peronospora effusa]|uniref:Uncharacterized protein n=1 Tax=Peronospora effusa TaxID=542832 RepID=A0A3R7XZA1_9STRA|nr:hypothetical protein DD237_001094 [Peronospora effusa]